MIIDVSDFVFRSQRKTIVEKSSPLVGRENNFSVLSSTECFSLLWPSVFSYRVLSGLYP